ncbi:DUF1566 domain-containing protein [Burkholderia pseudomallei]|uniref:DUF1566 domain-containing protein n=1 Tax=Burkholderia pseudomallei TaxID=28450 RepID=UPI000F0564E8|nr:DUF1566 domain-containing protein [Burkholderia pseudomallei]CAJ2720148.1 Uncharacterised protein [Burkholderia pseudomallei]VBX79572.1 Uncharacterised protein [Burkholderia pseudomallei]VBX79603.1 Uncharacterised protein [Burkholderia pseudomallei]VBX88983.1 Uncharacterised protein [Burkholderia pseudomallei]VBX90768.1 Uncharacterised protein [Burkholderia pseudomallei]
MSEITIPFHGGKLVVPQEEAARAWLDKVLAPQVQSNAPKQLPVRFGEYWPGEGGIYVGPIPDEKAGLVHHLIASIDEAESLAWGAYGTRIDGVDDKLDGRANTLALVAATTSHPAAEWAAEYMKDGHRDFYLPAQRELSLAWATCAGKFAPAWYWSSTQYSAYDAWYQYFGGGTQRYAGKDYSGRVRAFRRFAFSL